MTLLVENKTQLTQNILEQLAKTSGKIAFMPDNSVVDALRLLEEKGIPNNKREDYKYCNIEAVLRKEFRSISNGFNSIKNIEVHKLKDCTNIVVLNGEYQPALSEKAEGFLVSSFEEADKKIIASHLSKYADPKSDPMIALNTVFSAKGLCIHVKGLLKKPIHILNIASVNSDSFINPRQLIVTEKSSEATIIQTFVTENSTAKLFQNHLSEIVVAENSKLDTYVLQNENESSFQVNTVQASVAKYGNFISNTFTFNGAFIRNNLNVALDSEACEAHLNGLFIGKSTQLIDNHTLVDHRFPNCQSNELYKGIVKDKSTGIFNGKIFVRKDAQKTNAYQSSKNILLSDEATLNTKPQLEIYADDVKCSHGTSTGKIDQDALFYLKARGIGEENARKLLLQAFAGEVINKIEIDSFKQKVTELFEGAL
jgi:Fe-S cluster assembly protein SufD